MANDAWIRNEKPDECSGVIVQAISFNDVAVSDSIDTGYLMYEVVQGNINQVKCNDGDSSNVSLVAPSSNSIAR